MGLGFNGGQLLGLAIGGCFCNDLQYVAHEMGVYLTSIEVDVTVDLEGSPLLATHAKMRVAVEAADKSTDVDSIIQRTRDISTVSNSLKRGVPVEFLNDALCCEVLASRCPLSAQSGHRLVHCTCLL